MILKKIKSRIKNFKKFYFDFFVFKNKNYTEIFTSIYENNYWDSRESKSGPGSDLYNTKNIRKVLPSLLKKYKIKKILDAPCGDFYWMKKVLNETKIHYVGFDIVPKIINTNVKKFSNKKTKFIKLNLINQSLPKGDILICRALLFHLSYKNIKKVLKNIQNSNIKYVLLTNSCVCKDFKNYNIIDGGYRPLNLFKYPFFFSKKYLYKFKDTFHPKTKKTDQEMILWKKEDFFKDRMFIL
jgi:hypothetical protein